MLKLEPGLLKIPLLICGACCVFAVGLVIAIHMQSAAALEQLNQTRQVLAHDTEILNKRLEGLRIFKQEQANFRIWYEDHENSPDKLSWMEQLEIQAKNLKIPTMAYNIKSRQPYHMNANITDGVSVYSTPIEFQAGLVHEGQLLALFNELRRADLGLFSSDNCEIAVNQGRVIFEPAVMNLKAACTLTWYEIVTSPDMTDTEAML